MPTTQANTWPPLVSGASYDTAGQKQLYGQEVLGSYMFQASIQDEFFFPVDGILTGYSAEGILYQNGARVPNAPTASWVRETPDLFRGNRMAFPRKGVVLLSDASMSIIDLEEPWITWMIAMRGDNFGLAHGFLGSVPGFDDAVSGFTPDEVAYQNGRVIIRMKPDGGSRYQGPIAIIFDFTNDRIFMEWNDYASPILLGYNPNPITGTLGMAISPSAPVSDPLGGRATFWSVNPALPDGLGIDPLSGIIYGTPARGGTSLHAVTALNPVGASTVNIEVAIATPSILTTFQDTLNGRTLAVFQDSISTP